MKPLLTLALATSLFSLSRFAFAQAAKPPVLHITVGTLIRIDGKNLVVKPAKLKEGDAPEVTVTVDSNTQFLLDGAQAKLEDLKPEMALDITSLPASRSLPARLSVVATTKGLSGTFVKLDGSDVLINVKPPKGEAEDVTVATDDKTRVRFRGGMVDGKLVKPKEAKLDDLKPGMWIEVFPPTGTAARIEVGVSRSARQPKE